MHDWRGKYVKPGSLVLYSVRSGSSMAQVVARVDQVVAVKEPYSIRKTEKAKVSVVDDSRSYMKMPRKATVTIANLTVIGD